MRTEQIKCSWKIHYFRHDVTKWRHNNKMFIDLESTLIELQFDVLLDMVRQIFKHDLQGCQLRPQALTMKVKADRSQKLISWAPIVVLYTHKVWRWSDKNYSKNKGFVDFGVWPSGDLDLWPWPSIFSASKAIELMSLPINFESNCLKTVTYRASWKLKKIVTDKQTRNDHS